MYSSDAFPFGLGIIFVATIPILKPSIHPPTLLTWTIVEVTVRTMKGAILGSHPTHNRITWL